MLHPLTYSNLGFHTLKIETYKLVKVLWKDSYFRVVLLQEIMRYLMTSCFAYDTCFNAFVLFLVLNFVWRTIDDFSAFTVTRNAAKISCVHVYTIKHPLTINLM